MDFTGKIAIVTGASSGIGRATSALLAEHGATVVAVARRKEKLDTLVEEAAAKGHRIVAVSADLTTDNGINHAIDATIKECGTIDILVNNAGMIDNLVTIHNCTDEWWDEVMNLNINLAFKMTRAAIKIMLPKQSGSIVNVSSAAGLRGLIGGIAYTTSKHALVGFTKNVAAAYGEEGIRTNCICPGIIDTEMKQRTKPLDEFLKPKSFKYTGFPVIGQADEVANAIVFLASDEASFINGAILAVDSGWTAL